MTTASCETCRAVLHLVTGSGSAAAIAPDKFNADEKEFEIDPADLMTNAIEYPKRLELLGKIKLAYASRVSKDERDKSFEDGVAAGFVDGLQMAFDLVRFGTPIKDPEPIRRVHHVRAKSDLLGESKPKVSNIAKEDARSAPKKMIKEYEGDEDDRELNRCEMAMLTVLAQMKDRPITRVQLSVLSGYKMSGSFDTGLAVLRRRGLVHPGADIEITREGLDLAGDVPPVLKGKKLLAMWLSKLETAEGRILQAIISRPGMSRDEIADATNYRKTGSFDTAIGKLRKLQLISKTKRMTPNELLAGSVS